MSSTGSAMCADLLLAVLPTMIEATTSYLAALALTRSSSATDSNQSLLGKYLGSFLGTTSMEIISSFEREMAFEALRAELKTLLCMMKILYSQGRTADSGELDMIAHLLEYLIDASILEETAKIYEHKDNLLNAIDLVSKFRSNTHLT
jgi:hypothetical protein